ncbi:MAG: hypothetical protein MJZ17_00985 [Bacteroidales bacterium]|nr:hypothetical protein [Bacteroidales bacterium]
MKRIAFLGSKELALQMTEFAEHTGEFVVTGYFDDFEERGKIINNAPILGKIDDVEKLYDCGEFDYLFVAVGYNNFVFRDYCYKRFKGKIPFANIISKGAIIHKDAKIGEGVYIGPQCDIGKNTVIGNNVCLHVGTIIAHDCSVGDSCFFAGRDVIAGFTHFGERVFVGISVCVSDNINIEDEVWIGLGCIVAQNLKAKTKYMSPAVRLVGIRN